MGYIEHFTDNDLYKYAMQNAVMQHYPRAKVRYKFIDRGDTVYPDGFIKALWPKIEYMNHLVLHYEERDFFEKNCSYLSPAYIDSLRAYKYNPHEIRMTQEGGNFNLSIEGYWYKTILWEVPLLSLISSTYFEMMGYQADTDILTKTNERKNQLIKENEINVAEFGTRRRFSYLVQKQVIEELKRNLIGTSNVFFAKEFDLKPIGTQAHEWYMFHAAKYGYPSANYEGMKKWVDTYQGDLGIVLPDTFTTDNFLTCFDKKFSKLYDGIRHDSGDYYDFTQKIIKHYVSLGIDPGSKSIVYSDGLTIEDNIKIKNRIGNMVSTSFGNGTSLSCDITDTNGNKVKPLNIVIKMSDVLNRSGKWQPTVKLSDVVGKHTGTKEAIEICQKILNF